MGKKDKLTKKYLSDNKRFADIFNAYLYDGKQIIRPDDLKELDTTLITNIKGLDITRIRDIYKEDIIKTDGKNTYLLLGIENQSNIDHTMPLRKMIYDALTYLKQLDNDDPYNKQDYHLKPIITLTLYWGDKSYDGPLSLKEMILDLDHNLESFIDDVKINLISFIDLEYFSIINKLHDENLRYTLEALYYRNDKTGLFNLLNNKNKYGNMSLQDAKIISEFTKLKIPRKTNGGGYDMCKAIEELKHDFFVEGKAEGINEGKIETIKDMIKMLKNVLGDFNLVYEQFLNSDNLKDIDKSFIEKIYNES